MKMNLALFASGTGTNVAALLRYLEGHAVLRVVAVFSNRANAGVHAVAAEWGIPVRVFNREEMEEGHGLALELRQLKVQGVVLAGFLWKIPEVLIHAFPDSWLNLHPSLLPRFGGEGMYGMRVHEAVLRAGDSQTGITVHCVNSNYDEGRLLAQFFSEVRADDTPQSLGNRVAKLEHYWYPRVVESYFCGKVKVE
jgi:phosphoribosylglycinamide formyltransferase-1